MRTILVYSTPIAVGIVLCGFFLWRLQEVHEETSSLHVATSGPISPAQTGPLYMGDFTQDPLAQGWKERPTGSQPFDGGWVNVEGKPNSRCLVVRQGYWEGPKIPVTPFQYYRLGFSARAPGGGYWAAVFYDSQGMELSADVYDSIWPSKEWESQSFCLRAHALATHVRLRFQAIYTPIEVGGVQFDDASSQAVREWADAIAARNPPLRYAPPPDRCRRLPRAMATLRDGGRLRVVMLGDSICNDMSNSLFETLLERSFPKTRFEVIASVRGGTGCQYYKEPGRVAEYVLRFEPDLAVIAAISHNLDLESIRNVVRQIRAGSACEILVLAGGRLGEGGKTTADLEQFAARMQQMARDENVEFLDVGRVWEQYSRQSPKPPDWFRRDEIHANSRGKQVLARILALYLTPDGAAQQP